MSCVAVDDSSDDACANCGKTWSDTVKLKECSACRLVKYCGVDCQRAHRKQHKKACKRRAAELEEERLCSQTTTATTVTERDVTLNLSVSPDERGEFGAFALIEGPIKVRGATAGSVEAVVIYRPAIPPRHFLGAMDGHSSELQWIGVTIYEKKLGRTVLKSLADLGDSHHCGILYVEKLHVDEEYRPGGCSDVGAFALRKLMAHGLVRKCSSAVYILDPNEYATQEVVDRWSEANRQEMMDPFGRQGVPPVTDATLDAKEADHREANHYARLDANQLLRNGFYQDVHTAQGGGFFGTSKRILVSALSEWRKPLKTHAEVAAVEFYEPEPDPRPPMGVDGEILELTKKSCSSWTGGCSTDEKLNKYRLEVTSLIGRGGSLARSCALHAASCSDDLAAVSLIISLDPSTVNTSDVYGRTPLMGAAEIIAGKSTNAGFPSNHAVLDKLLAAGADKNTTDPSGRTALGHFLGQHREYTTMMQATSGQPGYQANENAIPGILEIKRKLMPDGGATAADEGDTEEEGFINYKLVDPDDGSDDLYGDY